MFFPLCLLFILTSCQHGDEKKETGSQHSQHMTSIQSMRANKTTSERPGSEKAMIVKSLTKSHVMTVKQFAKRIERDVKKGLVKPFLISVAPHNSLYSLLFRKPNESGKPRPLIVFIGGGPGSPASLSGFTGIAPWTIDNPFPPSNKTFNGYVNGGDKSQYLYTASETKLPGVYKNPYSWLDFADLMFLDSPRGTGYSVSSHENYLTRLGCKNKPCLPNARVDFMMWLKTLYTLYPSAKKQPLFLVGSSYGAIQVTWYADAILKYNLVHQNTPIILKGLMLISPGILWGQDPHVWQNRIPPQIYLQNLKTSLYKLGLISKANADNKDFLSQPNDIAFRPWGMSKKGALYGLRYLNQELRQSIYQQRGKGFEPNIYNSDHRCVSSGGFPPWCYNNSSMVAFFNDKEVRAALTAQLKTPIKPWLFTNPGVNASLVQGVHQSNEDKRDLGKIFVALLKEKIKVIFCYGKSDLSVGTFTNGDYYAKRIGQLAYGECSGSTSGCDNLHPIINVPQINENQGGEGFTRQDLSYIQINKGGHLLFFDNAALGYKMGKAMVRDVSMN